MSDANRSARQSGATQQSDATRQPDATASGERIRASYDALPYETLPQHHTHPDLLATLGRLAGLETASPESCRFLEIGCGDGGNLLPMAHHLPESRFVGFDLSPRQIERGEKHRRDLELQNLELRVADLLEEPLDGPAFDYIVAHGVFSWIPNPVQVRLLDLCAARLTPDGIALISYNCFPGWHLRSWLRDLMQHEARGVDGPLEKVRRAVEGVRRLAAAVGGGDDERAALLRSACRHFDEYRERPGYLFHEYFEEHNQPFYYRDFVRRAGDHGLQVVDDADYTLSRLAGLDPKVAAPLAELEGDRLEFEQSLDFVLDRSFRKTLLCRANATLVEPSVERLPGLYATSAIVPKTPRSEIEAGAPIRFVDPEGRAFSVDHPVAKRVLLELAEAWPGAVPFDDLARRLVDRGVGGAPNNGGAAIDTEVMADVVLSSFFAGVVDLHSAPPRCSAVTEGAPEACGLARWQLNNGHPVTNPRHRVIPMEDPVTRRVFESLDGRRDRGDLLAILEADMAAGRLQLEGAEGGDPNRRRAVLVTTLDRHLRELARQGLLVPSTLRETPS